MLALARGGLLIRHGHRFALCGLRQRVGSRTLYLENHGVRLNQQLLKRYTSPRVCANASNRTFRTSCFLPCDELKGTTADPSRSQDNSTEAAEIAISALDSKESDVSKNSLITEASESDIDFAGDEKGIVNIQTYLGMPHKPTCAGCGVFLQSEESCRPGFVPSHKYTEIGKAKENSRPLICQRCFGLKHYNQVSEAAISSERDVAEFLSPIQRQKGLILYVVDVMSLPGSLVPGLLDVVGEAKRIVIVANKVDMLPVDGRYGKQEQHIKEVVAQQCKNHGLQNGNIKGICLISARTGFGIPHLINMIKDNWDQNGDVYLVGSVNSGKTTLFNLFLDLFNAHKKGDMLDRGTVSLWPGTTLSVLRFPLGHWMLVKLRKRLHEGLMAEQSDDEIEMDNAIIDKQETDYKYLSSSSSSSSSSRRKTLLNTANDSQRQELAVFKPEFVSMESQKIPHWFYDTPGFLNDQQVTNFLTLGELKLLNPTLWIVPRSFILKPGQTLLLGGLGRVDYMEIRRQSLSTINEDEIPKANQSVYFTVFASPNLPVHVTNISRAEEVYEKHLGTEILMIPRGDEERMAVFPKLKSRDFTVTGMGWKESVADVILSNIGWIAVTAGVASKVTVRAFTPNGIGLELREPALIPTSVTQRGRRGAKQLGHPNPAAYESSRRRSPQLVKYFRKGHVGVYQWVSQAIKKRKEQRYLAKLEKMDRVVERSLGSKKSGGISGRTTPEIEASESGIQ